MAHRVAPVECAAQPGLLLVGGHDLRLASHLVRVRVRVRVRVTV